MESLEEQLQRRAKRKQQMLETLEKEPNNLGAIKFMIKNARREEDIAGEREYLYRRLEIETNNPKLIIFLIRIARTNNDIDEEKALRRKILEMPIEDMKERNLKGALGMAVKDKNTPVASILKVKLRRFERTKRQNQQKRNKNPQQQEKKKIQSPVQKARRIIYESEDITKGAEEISKLIEGQDSTERALILAELYFQTGMKERAEKSLKAYKKTLDSSTNLREIRLINQAIELVKSTKTLPFKWEELWSGRKEQKITFPEAPGEDDEGR